MFGSIDAVVAQSLPLHGAFSPWWVLIWLALMLGCLLVVGGLVAVGQWIAASLRRSSHAQRRLRIPLSTDGTSNP